MPAPLPTGPLVTRASLAWDLRALGVRTGETLLVHSSLSSLGWVNGGQIAVVQALLDALGETGTLVVPTESGDLSDPATWSDPPVPEEWCETVRATMPVYDPRTTPTRSVGVIPETVRSWPGALRSAHPLTSFAALGPRAAEIVQGHVAECRLGERSPLGRLEERGARVLMLGTGYGTCTCFHLAEYRVPHRTEDAGRPGPAGWEHVTEVAVSADRFDELGAAFERDVAVVLGRVGAAQARLFPLGDAVSYAEKWLPAHRPCH
ncbi:AAC(3) family N-acetyltransferase [Streptomyces sp. NPDC050264]|uniref:aminoglycoside N(3)-acetyltransferase n=1 Tax=Streptomyces sp. NPDC050264 TaxID=3155038 RepID=UPI00343FD3E0